MLTHPRTREARPLAPADITDGVFAGYASVFHQPDLGNDVVLPGAFRDTLRRRGAAGIRMLFQHDPAEPIGVWEVLREDAHGLYVRGRLPHGVGRAREVQDLGRAGAIDGLSIGFKTARARRDRARGIRYIEAVDLWEISVVTFPLLPLARVAPVVLPTVKRAPLPRPGIRQSISAPIPSETVAGTLARIAARDRSRASSPVRAGIKSAALAADIAGDRAILALARAALLASARRHAVADAGKASFNPAQLRVPAGNGRESGRWAGGDDVGSGADVHLIGDTGRPVDLLDEEDRGGHTIKKHVGKSESYLLNRVRTEIYRLGFVTVGLRQAGSFPSLEAANKLVNSAISDNPGLVNDVASGRSPRISFDKDFGSRTGYEAFRSNDREEPLIRDTTAVRVVLAHDPQAPRGYRVVTAFPLNRN